MVPWMLALWAAPAHAQLDHGLRPRQIAEHTWVIEGAVADFSRANGCNIINTAFIATGEGVVVVNTGPSRGYGEQQRRAIERLTREPVRHVFNLNLHPDYFFGNQAWADRPTQALAGSIAGMRAEGAAYADNLYRLCGDWMKGTEPTPAREAVESQTLRLGTHTLELRRLSGHTGDDLVLIDRRTGVLFAGGLVFAERVPTTPHADPAAWLASLDTLAQWLAADEVRQVVPSHGPVHSGPVGVQQTRDWLRWLTTLMQDSAEQGLDLSELLRTPVPARFAGWAAQPAELHRSLAQWYPQYEQRALDSRSR
ncbi:MAG: quinoprotein relay system zinc metallohydrolase 1 [Hydrogenophaga sp.]|uniref:quinoprotein relay system zinc metallohydrolase 1 n=1 Tax=Hydrogenophaga sp. TaxID=1904254 RepID=UPI0025C07AB0|nr:quinoprotein relay system zinc metallohydrolase 1 [Hydrogenophaga sp.]MBU7574959.1 quinoprotein relay system zinc metallohydrolase 1 [Hydrogenophaga sp.]